MKLKPIPKKFKTFFQTHPKKAKILLTAAVVILALGSWAFWAFAQSVIDSFNDTTKVAATWNTSVNTGAGTVTLAAKNCDIYNWFCSLATTCADTLGDGKYIIVNQNNASTTLQWKTSDTACGQPQCGINGGQDGDNLRADNTINFSSYPARDYCKSIGGRLPTIDELSCIYTNRASFGNNFGSTLYWSEAEYYSTNASIVYFSDGSVYNLNKSDGNSVRCVGGW